MSRKKIEINPLCGERVRQICEEKKITQIELAEILMVSKKTVNSMINGHSNVTYNHAARISEEYPEYSIDWIMGRSDFRTQKEFIQAISEKRSEIYNDSAMILHFALEEICERENIDMESLPLDDDPELLLIQAQLLDYANSLMWNYIKHRKRSHVWRYLDQVWER